MRQVGALPLVLVCHGGASSPESIAKISAMHRIAEREGFMVAYPAGTRGASGLTWTPRVNGAQRASEDALFLRGLIVDLQRSFEIDPTRIFAAGFSIGGALVYELADLFANRIAAIAVVGGTMTSTDCTPARPVPLVHIHGTADRRVPLRGGRGPATSATNMWTPVQECIDRWCEINGCTGKPQIMRLGLEGATGYLYTGMADVELWLVEGGGHAWPGGKRGAAHAKDAPTETGGFSASEKLWRFFSAHPRRRRRTPRPPRSLPMGETRPNNA